jgi:hypothetical protein
MENKRHYGWLGLVVWLGILWGYGPAGAQPIFNSDSAWGNFRWGEPRESRSYTREQAVAKYNYCPTGGCVLRLDSVQVRPFRARKGESLTLVTAYTILTPEQVTIPVSISREIFFKGKSLGKTKEMQSRKANGTWTQEINFSLPANAAAGDYTVVTTVSAPYGMDSKNAQFSVD